MTAVPHPKPGSLREWQLRIVVTNSAALPADSQPIGDRQLARQTPLRVGILCDLLEEGWPSMDLVADMLTQCFQTQLSSAITAIQLRPAMRRRLTRVPLRGIQRTAFN